MIQLSGKYGVFVTMGNCNDFAIHCLQRPQQAARVSSYGKIGYIAQVSKFGDIPNKAC